MTTMIQQDIEVRRRVLIVEDDLDTAEALRSSLEPATVALLASNLDDARRKLAAGSFAAVVLDLKLPDGDGRDLIPAVRARDPRCPVVILTARADGDTALSVLRAGADQLVFKPWDPRFVDRLSRLVADRRPSETSTPSVEAALSKLLQVRQGGVAVISGESGSGKDSLAASYHDARRRPGRFVMIPAARLTREVAALELYGHAAGAFPSAVDARPGLLDQARGGTLVIDGIEHLEPAAQSLVVSLIDRQPFQPLGSDLWIVPDFDLVLLSRESVHSLRRRQKIGEDLALRLLQHEVALLPLRDRRSEIPQLARGLLTAIGREIARPDLELTDELAEELTRPAWPGNLWQLRSELAVAALSTRSSSIGSLPLGEPETAQEVPSIPDASEDLRLASVVQRHVERVYRATGGNVTKTASLLGVSRMAVRRRLTTSN
jgi:DNA-binding NtrC family response regulator